jgi:hypothetical protein
MAVPVFEYEWEASPELEWEGTGESGSQLLEYEAEVSPIRKIYPDAMMEHMGHVAAEAESAQEAARAVVPLVPMAASKLPSIAARALPRVLPQLTHGVSTITQGLFRRPHTRPLVRAIPTIVHRTVMNLAHRASQGLPVSPQTAMRTLTQQASRVLRSPQLRGLAYRRSHALDRSFHRLTGTTVPIRRRAICPRCGVTVVVRAPSCCPSCGRLAR